MSDDGKPTFVATFDPVKERDARLSKRFYKQVVCEPKDDGHAVLLDAREIKTPGRRAVRLPNAALADAIAGEWAAQEKFIEPATMPRTRIVTTAIDQVALDREPAINEITAYAGTDLVCYRADEPDELVAQQAQAWDPLLDWLQESVGAQLTVTTGILHQAQADAALAQIRDALAQIDPIRLTALHTLVTISGSAVIGLAVLQGHLDADQGFAASRIDEAFQISKWGEDAEATIRSRAYEVEFIAAAEVIRLLD